MRERPRRGPPCHRPQHRPPVGRLLRHAGTPPAGGSGVLEPAGNTLLILKILILTVGKDLLREEKKRRSRSGSDLKSKLRAMLPTRDLDRLEHRRHRAKRRDQVVDRKSGERVEGRKRRQSGHHLRELAHSGEQRPGSAEGGDRVPG